MLPLYSQKQSSIHDDSLPIETLTGQSVGEDSIYEQTIALAAGGRSLSGSEAGLRSHWHMPNHQPKLLL